jgi:transcriptional regulator GlxA family with amidase domain
MRAAMPSPRHFLAAARVLYAHRLLQDPGFTVEDVAKRLGYSQVRTLQQHARFYLGLTAGEMRLSLTPESALQLVASRFTTLPRAAAAESEAS